MIYPYLVTKASSLELSSLATSEGTGVDPKKLLSQSFCEQAVLCMRKGDYEQGKELFLKAIEIEPNNPYFYFSEGMALFEYGSTKQQGESLQLSTKSFKKATHLKKDLFEAWLAWSSVLYELGKQTGQFHYILQAKNKLEQAYHCSQYESSDALSHYYFHNALVLSKIAEHSGEAVDYQHAIDAFEKANHHKNQFSSDFWRAYGQLCLTFAEKICDLRLYLKAISCFKHAIDTSDHKSWLRLAEAILKLYYQTHDEDHLQQAIETLQIALQLKADDDEALLIWADALIQSGRKNSDIKKLKAGIEKCQRALAYTDRPHFASALFAEALACLGELTERLDLIYEAYNKVTLILDEDEDNERALLSEHYTLVAFGKYFQDFDYLYQAIEGLQEKLSCDRTLHTFWYLMGKTYALIGDMDGQIDNYEKAVKFLEKAIELKLDTSYIYAYALVLSKLGEYTQNQNHLEHAVFEFERAITLQKNTLYTHPSWLFHWARTLDILGNFHEEEFFYTKALEIYNHVQLIDPDFPELHHHIALCRSHLGELNAETENFYKAIQHFRLAHKHDEDSDQILLDWGITLISLSQYIHSSQETELLLRDAENKILQAIKLGNMQGHYYLACVYVLLKNHALAFYFLEKAYKFHSLPPLDEILNDDWLDDIKESDTFQSFLLQVENQQNCQEER